MWFRKKIKETPKQRRYGRKVDTSNSSIFDGMSIIEQFAMIMLPCVMGFVFYMMCDIIATDLKWWIRLPISVGSVVCVMTLIWGFATWMSSEDWH